MFSKNKYYFISLACSNMKNNVFKLISGIIIYAGAPCIIYYLKTLKQNQEYSRVTNNDIYVMLS